MQALSSARLLLIALAVMSHSYPAAAIDRELLGRIEAERTRSCVLDAMAVDASTAEGLMMAASGRSGAQNAELAEEFLDDLQRDLINGRRSASLGDAHPLNALAGEIASRIARASEIRAPYEAREQAMCGAPCLEYRDLDDLAGDDPRRSDPDYRCLRRNPEWLPRRLTGSAVAEAAAAGAGLAYVCRHSEAIQAELRADSAMQRNEQALARLRDRVGEGMATMRVAANEQSRQQDTSGQDFAERFMASYRAWAQACRGRILLRDVTAATCEDAADGNPVCAALDAASADATELVVNPEEPMPMRLAASADDLWEQTGDDRWAPFRPFRADYDRISPPATGVPASRGNLQIDVRLGFFVQRRADVDAALVEQLRTFSEQTGLPFEFGEVVAWPLIQLASNIEAPYTTEDSYFLVTGDEDGSFALLGSQPQSGALVSGGSLLPPRALEALGAGGRIELQAMSARADAPVMLWFVPVSTDGQAENVAAMLAYMQGDFADHLAEVTSASR